MKIEKKQVNVLLITIEPSDVHTLDRILYNAKARLVEAYRNRPNPPDVARTLVVIDEISARLISIHQENQS